MSEGSVCRLRLRFILVIPLVVTKNRKAFSSIR
jgi:hypothetical protein